MHFGCGHKPLVIEALLFHNFEMLDVFGPLQAFKSVNNAFARSLDVAVPTGEAPPEMAYTIRTVAWRGGNVCQSSGGPSVGVDRVYGDEAYTCGTDPECDARTTLLVPGGAGTRLGVDNAPFIEWLTQRSRQVSRVATVCTGSALLARTGLLDGLPATSNKLAWDWVLEQGTSVQWRRTARWVKATDTSGRDWWTSSGISAGIDMAFKMVAEDYSEDDAFEAAEITEYLPTYDASEDPFAFVETGRVARGE